MLSEGKNNRRKASAAKKSKVAAAPKDKNASTAENSASEISEPRWSVVSFEKCAARNLTYAEALKKLKQLEAKKVSGLCIITDKAAARIFNNGEQ
jgi:uncharacterized protein (DUF885 family)